MYWVIGELGLCIISHNYWTVVVIRTINCTQAFLEGGGKAHVADIFGCQLSNCEKKCGFYFFFSLLNENFGDLSLCANCVRWGLRKDWQLLALSNLQHNFLWHFIFWMDHTILTILNKTWLINEKLKWPFISFHVSWKLQCR